MRRNLWTALGLVAIGALLVTSYAAGKYADERAQRSQLLTSRELIYLPSPGTARVMSFGFQQLAADWYWVRAIQYFVEPAHELNQYRNLGDFLEVVVGVDPDLRYAYKFAGITIPYDVGRLRFSHTDQAIDFLERGLKRWPDDWQMRLYLGFLLNFRNDPVAAAEQFALAAPIPGAPPYLSRFAAKLLTLGGEVDRARLFTEHMLAVTEDPEERGKLEKRLREIQAEAAFREVETAAERFRAEQGRWPVDLDELGRFSRLPPCPPGRGWSGRSAPRTSSGSPSTNIKRRVHPSSAMTNAIELRNLDKSFRLDPGRSPASAGLVLTVKPGRSRLPRPNGAGRHVDQILVSLLRPDAGTAVIFRTGSSRNETRARVGYLPESPVFYDQLTGREFWRSAASCAASGRGAEDALERR
jgi:hypothetical protein